MPMQVVPIYFSRGIAYKAIKKIWRKIKNYQFIEPELVFSLNHLVKVGIAYLFDPPRQKAQLS
jgi:hypothetical protein